MTSSGHEEASVEHSRHWSFYLVLVVFIFPTSVPAAWLYVAWSLTPPYAPSSPFLLPWCLLEVAFTIYQLYLIYRVNKPSRSLPPVDMHELQRVLQRVLRTGLSDRPIDEETLNTIHERPGSPEEPIIQLEEHDPRAIDFRNTFRTWFGKCAWSSIRLDAVHQWLYWSIFNEHLPPSLDQLSSVRRTFLHDAVAQLEKRLGVKIPEGKPQATPMRLTLDPVRVVPRPFWWYVSVALINSGIHGLLKQVHGTQYQHSHGVEYLIRSPPHWNSVSGPRPLVFIHGLGLGSFQYYTFFSELLRSVPDRPILFLLQPHISQAFFHPRFLEPSTRKDTGNRLIKLLTHLGWINPTQAIPNSDTDHDDDSAEHSPEKLPSSVDIISHSNGSYTHAWLCKDYPAIIHRSVFVDPTCFVLSEGDVCYNFLYRPCTTSIQLIMRFFVGTELGVANLLHRHFQWSDNNLWFEEIPNARDSTKNLFVVGGRDDIVNAKRVRRYLRSHGISKGLLYDPEARHGQALLSGGTVHTEILDWLKHDPQPPLKS